MTRYEQLQEHLKDNQSTWLVTGVAGFIGSNLLENLLILNQKVVGLDSFDTGYQHNVNQAIQDGTWHHQVCAQRSAGCNTNGKVSPLITRA